VAENGLQSWMKTLLAYVRSGDPDLTNRQMALLLLVYLKPGPHTVRGLAKALNVSKPVVTRALNRLGALGYLRRQRDDADRRNIFVAPTQEGAEFLEHFTALIGKDGGPANPADAKPRQRNSSREPVHA
jgi:DNA-binding MarR family transcriptional regulator